MRLFRSAVLGAVVAALSASPLFADFSYTETTQITGGSMLGLMKMAGHFSRQASNAGQPVVSTVSVKGNRMSRVNPTQMEIIDLDAETITMIDPVKREYTVETFEQMKQQIEAAEARAQQEQQKAPAAQQQQTSTTQVKFTVHVRNTDQSKDVSGLQTTESIMTMNADATDTQSGQTASMAFTNDMWMAPEVPGYSEVVDFYRRFAEKMGSVFGNSVLNPAMLAQYRGAGDGLKQMAEEMSKLKGTPIEQVMRMGMTTNGQTIPAASEAPLPASNGPAMPGAGDVAKESATSAIASKLGGFGGLGGFGHKKQQASQQPDANAGADATQPPPYTVLLESNTQLGNFSRTVSDSAFAVPDGFKQVPVRGVN
ncbi:hypothetical protein GCM10011507_05470 [Edaphobacter acidisoli]|uniref:DUF4412 domain-containing protein n=1 Tax=Edaphobacter acidisoli TaxID=2040573 RepID=A0A916W0S3_9BACT|nr:hypothetical protein [Edaphobacter acidisoli]GGA57026.1 hypothetical protein GCM10011507_05470 [Edaphobacter acidisoli]